MNCGPLGTTRISGSAWASRPRPWGAWESRNHIPTEKRLTRWDPEARTYAPLPEATIERMARQFEIALEFPTVTVRSARPKQHKPPHRDGR